MQYFRPGSQLRQLITMLSIVGEYPIRSLYLLGNERAYKAMVHKLTTPETFRIPQSETELTTRLLTVTGKGNGRSVRFYKGALPILDWLHPDAYRYYMDAFWEHKFPGNAAHRDRNHRVAEAVAMCMRSGIECRPYILPILQNRTITQRMADAISGLKEQEVISASGDVNENKDYINILLIGTDERTEYFNDNARGDSCMILTLGKKDGSVKLASLERGMGVPILEGQYEGEYDWLTHTFRYGGADLMMREVRECFKVDVDRYIRVNFATFVQGIESVGGVDISLTEAEAAYINKFNKGGITCVAGQNHLDGRAALEYARCRKIDSDWQRVKRQRNVIQAAVNSTKDLSISELNDLMNQVFPLVQTNLSKLEITELLMLAPKCRGASIQQITIPIKDSYGGMTGLGGRSLFSVNFDTNARALREFMYGENSNS